VPGCFVSGCGTPDAGRRTPDAGEWCQMHATHRVSRASPTIPRSPLGRLRSWVGAARPGGSVG
jgi:hypothetical protein